MRSNNKERLAQGAKLIYDKNLKTEMTYKNPSFGYLYIRISKEIGNEIIKVWSTTMKSYKKSAVNFDKIGVASMFRS